MENQQEYAEITLILSIFIKFKAAHYYERNNIESRLRDSPSIVSHFSDIMLFRLNAHLAERL